LVNPPPPLPSVPLLRAPLDTTLLWRVQGERSPWDLLHGRTTASSPLTLTSKETFFSRGSFFLPDVSAFFSFPCLPSIYLREKGPPDSLGSQPIPVRLFPCPSRTGPSVMSRRFSSRVVSFRPHGHNRFSPCMRQASGTLLSLAPGLLVSRLLFPQVTTTSFHTRPQRPHLDVPPFHGSPFSLPPSGSPLTFPPWAPPFFPSQVIRQLIAICVFNAVFRMKSPPPSPSS